MREKLCQVNEAGGDKGSKVGNDKGVSSSGYLEDSAQTPGWRGVGRGDIYSSCMLSCGICHTQAIY
jgi:hypothetical protein